jgi:hypothetical protein
VAGVVNDGANVVGLGGKPRRVLASEAEILDERSLWELPEVNQISRDALGEARRLFPGSPDNEDDHTDAFRHAYWNARMTQEFGEDWTRRFTTAHEMRPGNPAVPEAMDLYNNEVGRAIGVAAGPNATPQQIADMVTAAVREGRVVVVGRDGLLDFSDQLTPADSGTPRALAPVTGERPNLDRYRSR